jgi:uncharacterized membrane protein YfhO
MKISALVSLFAGLVISISGITVPRLEHGMIMPGLGLLPWIMYMTGMMSKEKSLKAELIWVFILSQQIFTAFPQIVFITLLFAFPYYLILIPPGKNIFIHAIKFISATVISILVSAVQVLPSYEYHRMSLVNTGFDSSLAGRYSYFLSNLVTFIDPFFYGNPKLGSYADSLVRNGYFFWENAAFIGWLPIISLIVFLYFYIKKRNSYNNKIILFFIISILISFLLMLGNNSPLYLMFSFWPFNVFRTPSRYLWIFVFSILFIGCRVVNDFLYNKKIKSGYKILLILLMILNIFQEYSAWKDYHALYRADAWMKPPEIIAMINNGKRIMSYDTTNIHESVRNKKGWNNIDPYVFLRNSLYPDSNMIWNISNISEYSGIYSRRSVYLNSMLSAGFETDDKLHIASVSGFGQKILDILSVNFIVTPSTISSQNVSIDHTIEYGDLKLNLYNNHGALNRIYKANSIKVANSLESSEDILKSPDFIPGSTVLLEKNVNLSDAGTQADIRYKESPDNTKILINIRKNSGNGILVLADKFYPGWNAFIDGQKTEILPANINQRAIYLPSGNHDVEFIYEPISFRIGLIISLISCIVILLIIVIRSFRLKFLNSFS